MDSGIHNANCQWGIAWAVRSETVYVAAGMLAYFSAGDRGPWASAVAEVHRGILYSSGGGQKRSAPECASLAGIGSRSGGFDAARRGFLGGGLVAQDERAPHRLDHEQRHQGRGG